VTAPGKTADLACPDCGAGHLPTCPLARAVEEVVQGDVSWFRKHPRSNKRTRSVTPAEVSEMAFSAGFRPLGDVSVMRASATVLGYCFSDGTRSGIAMHQVTI